MKRNRGFFRGNCLAAKERLGGGFWTGAINNRDIDISQAAHQNNNNKEASCRFINQLKNSVKNIQENNLEDEQLYNRVCIALNTVPNSNPLSNMLDRDHMATLKDTERERYVFTLSEKVRKCVHRYEQEKEFALSKIAR